MPADIILAAVDFSETATKAVRFAIEHLAPGAELVVLHVIDVPAPPAFAREKVSTPDVLEAKARERAAARMHELSSYLTPFRVHTEIRVGRPHEQVAQVASELGVRLVVIGPHSGRPRPSRFLGTTADRIARTCPTPVLIATNPPAHEPRRILVPIDDDSADSALVQWTRELATRFHSEVTLLHVWSNAEYSHVASMSYATAPTESAARNEIERELSAAACEWMEGIGRTIGEPARVTALVRYGNAGDVTIEAAESTNADLIVIGRHGSRELAATLLGSTVGTVLHGARCPVLVVPRSSDTDR